MVDSSKIVELGALGASAGAIFAVWRLWDKVKAQGARDQQIEDRLTALEKLASDQLAQTKAILDAVHGMELRIERDHGEMAKQIAVLEVKGCAPSKDGKAS